MKEALLILLVVLFAWSNKDQLIPIEYQFWKQTQTWVRVQNDSDQDISDVVLRVWSKPHNLGSIPRGQFKDVRVRRHRDITEVVIGFKYVNDFIERHAGTLDEDANYQMTISVNFAGVVTARAGVGAPEAQAVR